MLEVGSRGRPTLSQVMDLVLALCVKHAHTPQMKLYCGESASLRSDVVEAHATVWYELES